MEYTDLFDEAKFKEDLIYLKMLGADSVEMHYEDLKGTFRLRNIMYQINFEEGQCNEIVVDQCDIKVIFEEECQVEKLVINIRENFEKVPYVVAYESVGDIEINIGSCVGIMVIEDIIRRVKASRYSINIDRNSLIELIKLRGYDNDIDNRVQKEVDNLRSNLEDMYKYSMNELSVEIKDGLF